MMLRTLRTLSFSLLAVACADGDMPREPDELPEAMPTPGVASVSASQARVGEGLTFQGTGFVSGTRGRTELRLIGQFERAGGGLVGVDLRVSPRVDSETEATWTFGPDRIPFVEGGSELGTFHGDVVAVNVSSTGEETFATET